jgi:hypothetical protein
MFLDFAAEDEILDVMLDGIVELVAISTEELDAIVGIGVVRSSDHDPGIGPQATGDICDSGSG